MNPVLHTRELSVGYQHKIVVSGLTFHANAGEILTLIGPNGAGKSTVLKTIAAQLPPISGTIALCGDSLVGLSPHEVATRISLLLTGKPAAERMTCFDVAATGRYPYTGRFGLLSSKDREIVHDALCMVEAESLADTDFRCISDGQRQIVMLARAIAQQPRILLLDEPTSYLDISHKLRILTRLRTLAKERQIAVIQSLHELDLAQKFSDSVLCIHAQRAERCGTPEEIFSGDYISTLYGISTGKYDPLYGTAEASPVTGKPRIFVIGGNGSGIPVYRKLHRAGIPFAAGILHENDVDCPAAHALGAKVITERAFEPISDATYQEAETCLRQCEAVYCSLPAFGTGNARLAVLRDFAEKTHLLIQDLQTWLRSEMESTCNTHSSLTDH